MYNVMLQSRGRTRTGDVLAAAASVVILFGYRHDGEVPNLCRYRVGLQSWGGGQARTSGILGNAAGSQPLERKLHIDGQA